MRKTIGDWKKEWIETNGLTEELEVIIEDGSNTLFCEEILLYEGCFAKIPEELLEKKVIKYGQILASSVSERVGCYSLKV